MSELSSFWDSLLHGPEGARILNAAMRRAAEGLANLTGHPVDHDLPRVKQLALAEVATHVADPEAPAVGVYLKMEGGLVGWALLCLPLDLAHRLSAWVLREPAGSSLSLGRMQTSALAEVGNLVLAYFLNSIAEQTHPVQVLMPSPPAVVVDMMGTILNLLVTPAAAMGDALIIVETKFHDAGLPTPACFWVVPQLGPERA